MSIFVNSHALYTKWSTAEKVSTLTHYILNRLSHAIYWKSPISVLGISGYTIKIFLDKNGQTINKLKTLIRHRRMRLLWVCTVCQIPFYGSPDYNPTSILYKSTAGHYRPVSYPNGPITARYRFIKNANWEWIKRQEFAGVNPMIEAKQF